MGIELVSQAVTADFFQARDDTVVTWLGMAGALVNVRGTIIFIDPLLTVIEKEGERLSETGHRFRISLPLEAAQVPKADAVLYTHGDGDHMAVPTARTLDRLKPTFVATEAVQKKMAEVAIEPRRLRTAQPGRRFTIGAARIEVTPALHDWPGGPWTAADCCGYVIRTPDGSIWHPGDTRLIEPLLEVKDIDVLFFDVAAVSAHLGPEGSARLARSSGAKVMLAYHYGTYDMPLGSWGNCDPADALPHVRDLSARLLTPNPGQPLRLPLASSM